MTYLRSIKIESLKRNLFAPPFAAKDEEGFHLPRFMGMYEKGRNYNKACYDL